MGGLRRRLGCQVGALGVAAPEVVLAQVEQRAAEVRAERVPVPQVGEPARHPHERLLGEVLGRRGVAGHNVGEANHLRDVMAVELIEPTLLPRVQAGPHDVRTLP